MHAIPTNECTIGTFANTKIMATHDDPKVASLNLQYWG